MLHCYTLSIAIQLDERYSLSNLFNSEHPLHRNNVYYFLNNMTTTMGENIRYFMYKYEIFTIDEWKGSYTNILSKLKYCYLQIRVSLMACYELCMQRDIYVFQLT